MCSTVLVLQSHQLDQIRAHAEQVYPHECCGLLMGRIEFREGDAEGSQLGQIKVLVEVIPTENVWNSTSVDQFSGNLDDNFSNNPTHDGTLTVSTTPERHYTIAPEAMLEAQKQGRDRNLSIIGIYHSHPDHPATPSEFDRVYAWPEYSYVIVSVQLGKAVEVKSWQLNAEHQFCGETILLKN